MNNVILEKAKRLIEEYCCREFGEDASVDFSDLSKIPLAYTTTEDEKHSIQVNVNLLDFWIETFVDDNRTKLVQYDNLNEMVNEVLPFLSFDDLTCVSDEELEFASYSPLDEVLKNAVARSNAAGGIGFGKEFRGLE